MNLPHRDRTPGLRNPDRIEREIEPKAALRSDRHERPGDDELAVGLHHHAAGSGQAHPDFDIKAWFALEQSDDDQSRERDIAECWYG